jgi:hypothetical protein
MNSYTTQGSKYTRTTVYNFLADPLLKDNFLAKSRTVASDMEQHLKALIQQYVTRMRLNALTVRHSGAAP